MNPTNPLQNQIVFQALNHVEEMLNNTMRERLCNLEKTMKCKNYEVSQMSDECRREWLLCLLENLRRVDLVYKNFVSGISCCSYSIRRDMSYDKQIFDCSSEIMSRLCSTYKKFLIYDGKLKKSWLDLVDHIHKIVESWRDSPCDENCETDSDSDCIDDSQ